MNSYSFLFVMALILLRNLCIAQDDSGGYHGYERDALLAIERGFNSSVLKHNWTGIMCYMDKTPYWQGIECVDGRVTGIILDNMGLKGEIKADALVNLTELLTLSFRNNSITGNMPNFTNSYKLTTIDFSSNDLSGNISSSLLNLVSLESLQLQDNNLIGEIPGLNQSSLKSFNVSCNNLSGEIPETTTLQSFGISSYLGNENLCGPPTTTSCIRIGKSNLSSESNIGKLVDKKNVHLAAILIVVDVIAFVVILLLFIIYYNKYKKLKREMKVTNQLPRHEEPENVISEQGSVVREKGNLVFLENGQTRFELEDLLGAPAEGLGKGNFGNCYKALMETGPVVVKRLRDLKPLSSEEFLKHVAAIAGVKHPNLLPLLAYYHSKDENLFLYRFVATGNVFNRLHEARGTLERVPFRWSFRLAVARSVARALVHLHRTSSQTTAPHGNLKSSNVLLGDKDETWVTDYGLTSLIALPIAVQRMVSYKTPEYQSRKHISKKSDVWSYGCLLLELLTGRIPAHSAPEGTNGVDLCSWVNRAVREEWTAEIFDTEIAVQRGANKGMLRLMQIALWCCEKFPEKRPEIGQVAREVEEIKAAGESEDDEYSVEQSLTDESFSATPPPVVVVK